MAGAVAWGGEARDALEGGDATSQAEGRDRPRPQLAAVPFSGRGYRRRSSFKARASATELPARREEEEEEEEEEKEGGG